MLANGSGSTPPNPENPSKLKPPAPKLRPTPKGGFCGDFADALRCGACKLRFYCSEICQKEDSFWVPRLQGGQGVRAGLGLQGLARAVVGLRLYRREFAI